ncbi:MAG: hypothetical protein E7375_04040 [Clostridiales bacterium]|nr:hypothetical protein [Clostridiales bacterium]
MKRKLWCMLLMICFILPSVFLFGGCGDEPRSIADSVLMPHDLSIYWNYERSGTYNDGEKDYEWSFTCEEIAEILYENGLFHFLGEKDVEHTLEEKKELLRKYYRSQFISHYPTVFVGGEDERFIILGGYDSSGNPYNQEYKLVNMGKEGFYDLDICTRYYNNRVGRLVASSNNDSLWVVFLLRDPEEGLDLSCVWDRDFNIPEDCEGEVELTAQDGTKKNVKIVDLFRTDEGSKVVFSTALTYIEFLK